MTHIYEHGMYLYSCYILNSKVIFHGFIHISLFFLFKYILRHLTVSLLQ